jgi:RNA polymerase sigma-70 factor (ECF subfamily)
MMPPELARAVAPHLARLRAVAERILGCQDDAHDAVQEVLVTLWRTPEMPQNLRAWLTRTVIHRALHARRTSERRRKWEELAGIEALRGCLLCDPEQEAEGRELRARLDAALRALSEEHLRVIELRALEGLDYEDIATRLGVPVGTVRSRLNRARFALRDRLEALA